LGIAVAVVVALLPGGTGAAWMVACIWNCTTEVPLLGELPETENLGLSRIKPLSPGNCVANLEAQSLQDWLYKSFQQEIGPNPRYIRIQGHVVM